MASLKKPSPGDETLLTHLGRWPDEQHGLINTPVSRASTILFPDLDTLENHGQRYTYGLRGTPSTRSVEEIITALEQGENTKLVPSGLNAISCALLSVLRGGDEILVTDNAYDPSRIFCDGILKGLGVTTRYFDPRIGADISEVISEKTRAILLESPGSLTFEIQDLPEISQAVKGRNIAIVVDNTWATPLFHKPLTLGADIVVHACTKMFVGHADVMLGSITTNAAFWPKLKATHGDMGLGASPDDCYLTARGLRTLSIRMKEHQTRALDIATWLEGHDLVTSVLHPALPSHPDHALFTRDFSGSGSLFSFTMPTAPRAALASLIDHMELFGIGYSWGGFASLILPVNLSGIRSATSKPSNEQIIRLHIGLEDVDDLKQDIEAGLERYRAMMG